MEPLDLWTMHLPAHLRAQGPRIEPRDGVGCLMVEDTVVRRFSSLSKASEQAKTFAQGASDPEGRLRDLDADGVWGEVMYPNVAFFCCFFIRSPELQVATARLYNDWVADLFLGGSGVLARFPGLRVVMVECGSGWLAWVLHAMDDAYREHHMFVRPKLELLPSEYFRRQGAVTFQHDPVGLANIPFTGDRCLL